jgi:hypothetical protein
MKHPLNFDIQPTYYGIWCFDRSNVTTKLSLVINYSKINQLRGLIRMWTWFGLGLILPWTSLSNLFNQVFLITFNMATSFILVEKSFIHSCFLLLHVIRVDLNIKTYVVVDFQSWALPTQSTSKKSTNLLAHLPPLDGSRDLNSLFP